MVQIIFVYSVQIETKKYDPEASYVLDLIFEISIHVTSKEITIGKKSRPKLYQTVSYQQKKSRDSRPFL